MCIKLQKCVKKDEETRFWLLERCVLPMSRTTDKTTVYQPTGHFVFLTNKIIFFRLSYTRQESWILLLGCDRSRLCKFIFLNNYEKKESVYVFRLLNTRGQPTFRFHLTKIVASCIRRVQTSILLETDIPSRPLLRSPSQIPITRPERRAGQLEQGQCKNHSKAREWFQKIEVIE